MSSQPESELFFNMGEATYPFYRNVMEQRTEASVHLPTLSDNSSVETSSSVTTDYVIFSDDTTDRVLRNRKRSQQDNNNVRRKRKNNSSVSGTIKYDKLKPNVFVESEKSLKSRRAALILLCQKNEKRVVDLNNKITALQKLTKQTMTEIQEIDNNLEQWVIEKRKQHRESVHEAYLKKYEWAFTNEQCPVCFEFYKESIRYDTCNHVMCADCNDSLLSGPGEKTCPLCRNTIKGYTKFDETILSGIHYDRFVENDTSDIVSIIRRTDEHIDLTINDELV